MANLWTSLFRRQEISRYSLSDYIRQRVAAVDNPFAFAYAGPSFSTYRGRPVEKVEDSYASLASYAYRGDSVVAACMRVRRDLFRQAKFCWREVDDAGPGKVFRTDDLSLLDRPWPNGTTGELLARMITDVDLCGNSFIANEGERLRWLRPDWMSIILSGDPQEDADIDVMGYVYTPGGTDPEKHGVPYKPSDICHWSPEQDPLAFYRGMSWVSKALEEVQGDRAATTHKVAFFRNGATLGPIVRVPAGTSVDQFKEFMRASEEAHAGAANAYRTMYIGGGAEVTLAAADFRQLDLKAVQGGMETRIAAVAGVHPVLVGLSEGLAGSSLNSGNFAAARRSTAEMTLFALWQDACGALQAFFDAPKDAELWIRERDIPFLRDEAKDRAEIIKTQILAIEAGMRAGFKPDATVKSVLEERLDLLVGEHTGLFSVQMQAPGGQMDGSGPADEVPPAGPIDFGALRADFWELDEDDILRAVEECFDLDDEEIERARYDVRVEAGHVGGGQFRKLSDVAAALLQDWAKGDGPADPLDRFEASQLREILSQERKKSLAAGDHDRVARLTPRRARANETPEQIKDRLKLALYTDVRGAVRQERDAGKPSAKFTLQGPDHRDLDVAVFKGRDGKPRLFKTNDRDEQLGLVEKFDSLDEMQAWADEHGEPKLSAWAGNESGAKTPAKKAAPRKAASTAPDPDALDGQLRDAKPEDRRRILEDAAKNQTQARRLASQLSVKGVSKLSRDEALDRIEAHYAEPGKTTSPAVQQSRLSAAEVVDLQNMDAMPHNSDWSLSTNPAARKRVESLVKKGYLRYARSGQPGKIEMTPEGRERARSEPLSPKSWEAQGLVPANPARKTGAKPAAVDHARVAQIASAFHEDWRKTRLQKDGTFEPRVKKTKDQAWIDAHGTDEVDIANSSYDELPDDWKAENRAAAEVVAGILQRHGGKVDLNEEKTRLAVGEEIHQAWLSRNSWAAGGELDVPFADLPADEQAKDIDQVSVAMKALAPASPRGAAGKGVPAAKRLTARDLEDMAAEDIVTAAGEGRVSRRAAAKAIREQAAMKARFGALSAGGYRGDELSAEQVARRERTRAEVDRLNALADDLETGGVPAKAAKPEFDAAAVAGRLNVATTQPEADAHLEGLTLPQLKQVASELKLPLRGGDKSQVRQDISFATGGATAQHAIQSSDRYGPTLGRVPDAVPAVDFLDRVHQGEEAGLSPEDARAFAASGLSLEEWRAQRSKSFDEDDIERADLNPDDDTFRRYWTEGEGLHKWLGHPHEWTALRDHLIKYVGPERADRIASEWFHRVKGFWPGSDLHRVEHGKPPRGDRIGPG